MNVARPLVALSLVLLLSACGGGQGGGGGTPVVPQAPIQPAQSGTGKAALSLFVPTQSNGASKRRALPSTTQSVEIVVANADGTANSQSSTPTIANVSATAPGCSSVSGGISCTENVSAPFGSVLFAVVAFTGSNATGNAIAWGYTVATISQTGANAVTISTSSVVVYEVMDLDGNISLATVDHNAMLLDVVNPSESTAISASLTYLPNGDIKGVVSSSTDPSTSVGDIIYARELVGSMFAFMSTGTTAPPATAAIASGADWGVGTAVAACPTQNTSTQFVSAAIEGPGFQLGSNLATGETAASGTAAVTVSSGSASLGVTGTGYNIGGTSSGSLSGTTGACSGGLFAASSQSGQVAVGATGVIIASNGPNGGTQSNLQDGSVAFASSSGTSPSLTALAAATYDGFIGGYNVTSPSSQVKEATPLNVAPGGGSTLVSCNYSAFEAGTIATGSTCLTVTLNAGPFPGSILASTSASVPAMMVASQISGKYVIVGVEGDLNFVLIQH